MRRRLKRTGGIGAQSWFLGLYWRREDPRVLVPVEPSRWRWTLNLGNPRSYLFLGGIAGILVVPTLAIAKLGMSAHAAILLYALVFGPAVIAFSTLFGARRAKRNEHAHDKSNTK